MQPISRHLRPALLVVAAVLAAGCGEPPTREIQAAEAALERARQAQAELYAPERLREAQAALDGARKLAESRDYRGALSSANAAAERARAAAQAAGAARTLAKSAAEVALAELQAVLDEVATVRQEAEEAKLPVDEAFAELAPRLESLQGAVAAVQAQVDGGDLLGAQKAALELKPQAADLPEAYRQARTAWEEAHPKGKAKGKPAAKAAPRKPAR